MTEELPPQTDPEADTPKPEFTPTLEQKVQLGCLLTFIVGFAIGLPLALSTCHKMVQYHPGSSEIDYGLDAKVDALAQVRSQLRDPDSAEFSGVDSTLTANGRVVCGYVNSRNGFGGMTGPQRFVVDQGVTMEEEVSADAMSSLWAQKCQ